MQQLIYWDRVAVPSLFLVLRNNQAVKIFQAKQLKSVKSRAAILAS